MTKDTTKTETAQPGIVETDEGKKIDLAKVRGAAIPDGAPGIDEEGDSASEKARILNWDEQKELLGELNPGEEGYLPLDEDGNVIGPAKRGVPPKGTLGARVVAPADTRPDLLSTPSGAPIMARMNPSFDEEKGEEEMEERKEEAKQKK